MEKFKPHQEEFPHEEPLVAPEYSYRALKNKEKDPIADFTPEQQAEIRHKQQILSSLAYFIGKDFRIPVELNKPGAGWHWDFKENVIRIDPKDLLEKPMDYLRFVISHEGGHRRISRTDFIPLEKWKQPGFSFMMNAIEDPRDNNFVAESYPKFQEQMDLAYTQDLDFEAKAKEKADQKLGYKPRFMQAGFEYIKQWFRETQGKEVKISDDLPEDVRTAVQTTLESARDSWLRYPSRKEADKSEELIRKYAQWAVNRWGTKYRYYRCSKKRGRCSQPYIQEAELARQIKSRLQTISLCDNLTAWMLERVKEWEREETSASQSEFQNLSENIKTAEAKMEKLVSTYLDGDIPKTTYLKKKDEILLASAVLEQKKKDFERGMKNWVEPLREWILDTKQADFLSKSENYHEIKTFVQKIGTNPRVRNKSAVFDFCPASQFAAKRQTILRSAAASRPRGAILSNREVSICGEGGI